MPSIKESHIPIAEKRSLRPKRQASALINEGNTNLNKAKSRSKQKTKTERKRKTVVKRPKVVPAKGKMWRFRAILEHFIDTNGGTSFRVWWDNNTETWEPPSAFADNWNHVADYFASGAKIGIPFKGVRKHIHNSQTCMRL